MKKTVTLTDLNRSEILDILVGKQGVIYGEKTKLTITLKDGNTKSFNVGDPFVVLEGQQILPIFEDKKVHCEALQKNRIEYQFNGYGKWAFYIQEVVSISYTER